jgi:uncharacterized membrane protein YbhN (UPF0104 family)
MVFLAFVCVIISQISTALRLRVMIGKHDKKIGFWTIFKANMVSAATAFSMVKFSDGLKVYFLKKKGAGLSSAMTGYVGERVLDVLFAAMILTLFLGAYSWTGVVLIFLAVMFLVVFSKHLKKFAKIRFLKFLEKMSDFSENLKGLLKVKTLVPLILLTCGNFFFSSVAIGLATGSGVGLGIMAFAIGMGILAASPIPAGIGLYEAGVSAYLATQGISAEAALGGILVYRFFAFWLPSIAGSLIIAREL